MAMDKNDKLTLFRKVPKVDADEQLELHERIQFLDIQIMERKKMLWREQVTVLQAEVWADEDDKDANNAAEQAVQEARLRMKSLKLELKALVKIKAALEAEFDGE